MSDRKTDMDDDRLEALLRQVRPSGPPPRLRARILSAPRRAPRAWPWVSAAAALLALTIMLPMTTPQPLPAAVSEATPWDAEKSRLTEMLGGDRDAEMLAAQIVAVNEWRARALANAPSSGNVERQ
jgi:hypothetical protein